MTASTLADLSSITVVVPILNSRDHLAMGWPNMADWIAHVGEVLVVDSGSTDGSREFCDGHFNNPNLRILDHAPGSYESWNSAIAEAGRPFINIATAGNAVTADDLACLLEVAESSAADVVCAPPRFVNPRGEVVPAPRWPIHELLERMPSEDVVLLEKLALMVFAMAHCRPPDSCRAWLGSSASNLYRKEVFDGREFPTDCGAAGEIVFGLRHAHELRAAFVRRACGQFVQLPPPEEMPGRLEPDATGFTRAYEECTARLREVLRSSLLAHADPAVADCLRPELEPHFWRALGRDSMMAIAAADESLRERSIEIAQLHSAAYSLTTRLDSTKSALKLCRQTLSDAEANARQAMLAAKQKLKALRRTPAWILNPGAWALRGRYKELRIKLDQLKDLRRRSKPEVPTQAKPPESAGRPVPKAFAIVTAGEINDGHGTGVLLGRIFQPFDDVIHIRNSTCYGGKSQGTLQILIAPGTRAKAVLPRLLGGSGVRRILSVPFERSDVEMALALRELSDAPVCVWIMDHNLGDVREQIPAGLMQELLDRARLRLGISPEMCALYEDRFGYPVAFAPPVVDPALAQRTPLALPEARLASPVGVILGNVWSRTWLRKLAGALEHSGMQFAAYGQNVGQWQEHPAFAQCVDLQGFLPEEHLVAGLRTSPFALVPTGTLDPDDDRPEISRYSLPSRTLYLSVVGNLPIIVIGSEDSCVAKFVRHHDLGVVVPYDGQELNRQAHWICQREPQERFRRQAARMAPVFAAGDMRQWLERSLKLGRPCDDRW